MTQLEQLQMIVDRLCFTKKAELQRRLQMQNGSTITGWFQRGSFDIRRIAIAFPEISIDWLVFGQGPMLKADCRAENYPCQSTDDINPDEEYVHTHEGSRPYEEPSSDCLQVREDTPFDLAWFNATLRENAQLKHRIEQLQTELTQAQCRAAVAEARIEGASAWYFQAVAKHPDLKP